MKRTLALLLSLVMAATALFTLPFTASALDASGKVTETINYTFDSATGELNITGTGALPNEYIENAGYLFQSNNDIKKIYIGEGITDVQSEVFNYCKNVTFISFPSTLKTIGGYAFGFNAITEITLPDGVETVSSSAFGYCDKVTSISISKSVRQIEGSSFDTTSLTEFTVDAENPYFTTVDGNLYNKEKTGFIEYCGAKAATEFTVPDGVTYISNYAFSTCPNIKKVTLPDGMTKVDNTAFRACATLEEIVLPETVTEICSSAFEYCYSLSKITFHEGITKIGSSAFEGCDSLGAFTLPKSLVTVEGRAFSGADYCTVTVLNPNCVIEDCEYTFGSGSKIIAAEKCDGTCSFKTHAQAHNLEYETLSVEEHKYEVTSQTEPTCTDAGVKYLKCSECNGESSEPIDALGHDMEIEEFGKEATCTEDGFLPYCHCKRCDGYFIDSEGANPIEGVPVIPAKGHTMDSGAVTKKATLKAAGVKTFTCTVCGATETQPIVKNNFTAKAKKVTVKLAKVNKKNQTVKRAKAITVKNAKGKVTYKIAKKNKNFTVAKNGNITVKKGVKAGTYKVKIKVTAAGNAEYAKATKTVTVTVNVK